MDTSDADQARLRVVVRQIQTLRRSLERDQAVSKRNARMAVCMTIWKWWAVVGTLILAGYLLMGCANLDYGTKPGVLRGAWFTDAMPLGGEYGTYGRLTAEPEYSLPQPKTVFERGQKVTFIVVFDDRRSHRVRAVGTDANGRRSAREVSFAGQLDRTWQSVFFPITTGGLSAGPYTVELLVDDQPAGVYIFTLK
jgi:hypothetical protein